jgi:hypothetical protein
VCDRPRADAEGVFRVVLDGVAPDAALCHGTFTHGCYELGVDWRARALAAEAAIDEHRERLTAQAVKMGEHFDGCGHKRVEKIRAALLEALEIIDTLGWQDTDTRTRLLYEAIR